MSGFIYNGQSTETILPSSKLMLCTFDDVDRVAGVERENIIGETTMTRPTANEYGTTSSPLLFEYALVKKNSKPFTDEEQISVERWITSPKFSRDLNIIDCEGNITTTYCGKFLSTEWVTCSGGYAGVVFSFQNNSAYPKKHYSKDFSISGNGVINIKCESDELEEYVYPVLTVTEPSETATVIIKNVTDNSNTMTIRAYDSLPMIFDCLHCIPRDSTTNGIVSYEDLGWTDVGNIYWLRLLPGENTIEVTGNAEITISYDVPVKRVGGWI